MLEGARRACILLEHDLIQVGPSLLGASQPWNAITVDPVPQLALKLRPVAVPWLTHPLCAGATRPVALTQRLQASSRGLRRCGKHQSAAGEASSRVVSREVRV